MKHSGLTFRILHSACCILAATSVFAGWEDTGAVRAPAAPAARTTPPPRPAARATPAQTPARVPARPAPAPEQEAPVAPRGAGTLMPPDLYSTFLDTSRESDSWYRIALVSSADVKETADSFGLFVADAHFHVTEFRGLLAGDLAIDIDPALTVLTDNAGFDFMPSALIALPVDFTWVWRYLNGWSFELGLSPGIYADAKGLFQAQALALPFRGCFYYVIDPDLSVRFGAEIRPGWDLPVMPLVGLAWQPSEMFFAEVGLPRSLAELQIGPVGIYGKIVWNNATYALDDGGDDPESFTLNGWQFGVGVSVAFTDSLHLSFETGLVAGRDITFEGGGEDFDCDVDSASYFALLLGAEF